MREWIQDFLSWLETENKVEIRGASLLIVFDDVRKVYRVRLIDLGSFEKTDHRDEGLILGVKNILQMLD